MIHIISTTEITLLGIYYLEFIVGIFSIYDEKKCMV